MMHLLEKDGCLYQQDVVDYLVKNDQGNHLKENADGNQALSTEVINKFRVDSGNDVFRLNLINTGVSVFMKMKHEDAREARG